VKFWSYNVSECGSKICNGSRSLRNIHGRSACTGRRKKKQEEDERWGETETSAV